MRSGLGRTRPGPSSCSTHLMTCDTVRASSQDDGALGSRGILTLRPPDDIWTQLLRARLEEQRMGPVWDGIVRSNILSEAESRIRHDLANAAKNYDWAHVFSVLARHNNLVNTTRPDGASFYTPLHQAAYGGAPEPIVQSLLDLGAWRTLQNSQGKRPVDVAEKRGHAHLLDALSPNLKRHVPSGILLKMQEHFHAVINSRASELVRRAGLRLPLLAPLLELGDVRIWFPIPGMAGGFAYRLASDGPEAKLVCDSWSRMVDGSGERHEVTSSGSRLIEEGFV